MNRHCSFHDSFYSPIIMLPLLSIEQLLSDATVMQSSPKIYLILQSPWPIFLIHPNSRVGGGTETKSQHGICKPAVLSEPMRLPNRSHGLSGFGTIIQAPVQLGMQTLDTTGERGRKVRKSPIVSGAQQRNNMTNLTTHNP